MILSNVGYTGPTDTAIRWSGKGVSHLSILFFLRFSDGENFCFVYLLSESWCSEAVDFILLQKVKLCITWYFFAMPLPCVFVICSVFVITICFN